MTNCSPDLFLTQFVDDSTITYSSNDLTLMKEKIEDEFGKVLEWLAANKLIINLIKTQLMVFTNTPRTDTVLNTVNNQTIQEVADTKFLGVILDNKLCWDVHIKHISNKMSKSESILKMLKYTFPTCALKVLY